MYFPNGPISLVHNIAENRAMYVTSTRYYGLCRITLPSLRDAVERHCISRLFGTIIINYMTVRCIHKNCCECGIFYNVYQGWST